MTVRAKEGRGLVMGRQKPLGLSRRLERIAFFDLLNDDRLGPDACQADVLRDVSGYDKIFEA